jgi:orotate phosphoribosyltransferase
MQDYQQAFIHTAIELGVLRFGEFKLKSGRISPYFFNSGLFNTGRAAAQLGRTYAAAIAGSGIGFDTLFGPAYKGIPLVALTAAALADEFALDKPWCFNRKEAKEHGEGGTTVGAPLAGRVLIVDDVITAGTAIRESITLIQQAGGTPAGVVIALDRQEKGQGEWSAVQEVQQTFQIPVVPLIRLQELVEHLEHDPANRDHLPRLVDYRDRYGVT